MMSIIVYQEQFCLSLTWIYYHIVSFSVKKSTQYLVNPYSSCNLWYDLTMIENTLVTLMPKQQQLKKKSCEEDSKTFLILKEVFGVREGVVKLRLLKKAFRNLSG